MAPFQDSSWEIWNLSPMAGPLHTDLPRWDRWYELHHLNEKEAECPGYLEFLKTYGDRVWIREPHPELPKAQIYPLQDVLERVDQGFVHPMRYYTNSVSLMMGHAILLGAEELALYGVDMAQTEEYQAQRPSCEVLVGYAAGAGIKVTIPEECDLLKCQRIYGIEPHTAFERKLAVHMLELEEKLQNSYSKINDAKKQMIGAAAAAAELEGLTDILNGQLSDELKGMILMRQGNLKKNHEENRMVTDRLDEEIKLYTGAIEECRYQRQFC